MQHVAAKQHIVSHDDAAFFKHRRSLLEIVGILPFRSIEKDEVVRLPLPSQDVEHIACIAEVLRDAAAKRRAREVFFRCFIPRRQELNGFDRAICWCNREREQSRVADGRAELEDAVRLLLPHEFGVEAAAMLIEDRHMMFSCIRFHFCAKRLHQRTSSTMASWSA